MAKRVGRPAIPESQKRSMAFRFVATKEEAVRLRRKAKELGLSISDYLRRVAIPKE